MLDKYVNIVRNFKSVDFVSLSLQEEMATKLYNAKAGLTGEHLWAKFMDWRKEIHTKYSPKLPKELSSLPSGHQMRDVYKKFVPDSFKEANVSSSSFSYVIVSQSNISHEKMFQESKMYRIL